MRVLTRDRDAGRAIWAIGVDVVVGDVREPSTLASRVDGVTTVVSAVQGFAGPGRVTPASVDRDGNANLVDAAAAAGADVVLMSVVGASPDSPMELFRAKYEAEAATCGPAVSAWTIVRATAFVELWAELVGKGLVFGRGDNPINFVSVVDVAAAVERAVTDRGLRGTIIEVGGAREPDVQRVRGRSCSTFGANRRPLDTSRARCSAPGSRSPARPGPRSRSTPST